MRLINMNYFNISHSKLHVLGALLILFAFLCAAILSTLAKVILLEVPLGTLLCMQNVLAFCLYLPFCSASSVKLRTQRFGLHFMRALLGLFSYICLFIAVKHISLANATLLANSSPLFLPFVVLVWFRQKISVKLWISLLIGFSGVLFVINPKGSLTLFFDSWFVLIALLGGLFSAIALQCIRNLSKTESPVTINFYYFTIVGLLTLPWMLMEFEPISKMNCLLLLGTGLFLAVAQLFFILAYKCASPTLLGPFNYSVVVFAGIIQWIFWNEIPTVVNLIGIFLISLGGILSLKEQNKARND